MRGFGESEPHAACHQDKNFAVPLRSRSIANEMQLDIKTSKDIA
jgi:hypothetical protein